MVGLLIICLYAINSGAHAMATVKAYFAERDIVVMMLVVVVVVVLVIMIIKQLCWKRNERNFNLFFLNLLISS